MHGCVFAVLLIFIYLFVFFRWSYETLQVKVVGTGRNSPYFRSQSVTVSMSEASEGLSFVTEVIVSTMPSLDKQSTVKPV